MATIYDTDAGKVIGKASVELKKLIKAPDWSIYVKTGAHKERPPEDKDWWYVRAAALLRSVYMKGPIGTSKLRTKYGGKKNMGHKPERVYRGSGKIIRTILQQLEKAELIIQQQKGVHKGRIITPKGKSILDKSAK